MRLYKHKNYKEYKKIQTKANKRKIRLVWAAGKEIEVVSNYIKEHIPDAKFGICHGVRNGWEVERFRKHLGIKVIGTEISDTANDFKNVINWDFHKIKPEWIGNVDFIYSNSLDHSYDPGYCITQWMKCLKPSGRCFVEWSNASLNKWDECDCFSASDEEYHKLFSNNFVVETVVHVRCSKHGKNDNKLWKKKKLRPSKRSIFVIRNH